MLKNSVEVYCQFDPLEEIWLGGCYPEEFYQDLNPEIRSIFSRITEITKQDLDKIEQKLQSLGIKVRRPEFTSNSDDYRDNEGRLLKPPICPRDDNMVLGQNLYHLRHRYPVDPWESTLQEYQKCNSKIYRATFLEKYGYIQPPAIVRLGKDLLIDYDSHAHSWNLIERDVFPEWQKEFRIIVCRTNGHSDAVFTVLNPDNIFTRHWKSDYSTEFPGWEVYKLAKKGVSKLPFGDQLDWWIEDKNGQTHPAFNQYIQTRASDWIGNAQETVFEVNSLMINESLIMTTGTPDDETKKWFKKIGVDYIPVEFSARTFWDGGLHCLTTDIRRNGIQRDLFPDRNQDIYYF